MEMPPTPNHIMKIARNNPIIKTCLDMWLYGNITWEQALMTMVHHLANQNEQIGLLLNRQIARYSGSVVIQPDVVMDLQKPCDEQQQMVVVESTAAKEPNWYHKPLDGLRRPL